MRLSYELESGLVHWHSDAATQFLLVQLIHLVSKALGSKSPMPKYEKLFPTHSKMQADQAEKLDPGLAALMGFSDDQL